MTPDTSLTVPARFCGPPGMGNGGYVSGRLAGCLDGPVPGTAVEVTLRRPTPLDRRLDIVRQGTKAILLEGDSVLAEASPATMDEWHPDRATFNEAAGAATLPVIPHARHPLPHCFVCGPERKAGDGLCIHPGRLGGPTSAVLAAPWIPDAGLGDRDGRVLPEFIWAALDCPGGFAVVADDQAESVLLGRLAVRIVDRPAVGETCSITARRLGRDGRKLRAGSALYGATGDLLAVAMATWISVPPEALRAGAA